MPNPYFILAAVLAIIGAYFYGRHDGEEIQQAAQLREERIAVVAREEAMKSAAEAISKISVTHKTIQGKLEREVRENTIYRDCRVDDISLRLVNAAITNTPVPAGSEQLPGAGSSGRPDVRRSPPQVAGSGGAVSQMSSGIAR